MPDDQSNATPAPETSTASTGTTGVVTVSGPAIKGYTQEQIDAMVESRLNRERAKFADYGDLKRKAEQFDEVVEKSKTEQQRAVDAARSEGEEAAAQRWQSLVVSSEVRAQAAQLRFHDPSDAVAQLHAALGGITVKDTGDIDREAITKALGELAKAKPYLIVDDKPTRPNGDAGQGPRGGTAPTNMNELIRSLGRR